MSHFLKSPSLYRAAARALQSSEIAHKHTTAELQRTRTLLQGVRATHQSELKKREKDIERMSEKWSKLADLQTKLAAIPSGMQCANVGVVDGSEVIGKGQGFLEIALEEAENARCQLGKENIILRKLVLTAVNEIQSVLHQARSIVSDHDEEVFVQRRVMLWLSHLTRASGSLRHSR
jgi:hypothetical protein